MPHTADVAIEAWGRDLPELFVHAAQGMLSLAVTVEPGATVTASREVSLEAPDWEALLVDWLNELLALQDEHGETYVAFDVSLSAPGQLRAHLQATQAYRLNVAIKAATFHNLAIRHDERGYRTVVVFDV